MTVRVASSSTWERAVRSRTIFNNTISYPVWSSANRSKVAMNCRLPATCTWYRSASNSICRIRLKVMSRLSSTNPIRTSRPSSVVRYMMSIENLYHRELSPLKLAISLLKPDVRTAASSNQRATGIMNPSKERLPDWLKWPSSCTMMPASERRSMPSSSGPPMPKTSRLPNPKEPAVAGCEGVGRGIQPNLNGRRSVDQRGEARTKQCNSGNAPAGRSCAGNLSRRHRNRGASSE